MQNTHTQQHDVTGATVTVAIGAPLWYAWTISNGVCCSFNGMM